MQKIPLVDLSRQYQILKPEIDAAILDVIERSAFILGKDVTAFETAFSKMCGAQYGVGASSGTSALFLALMTLNLKPGDEVLTVPNTFIATAEAISQAGGRPVFVDIDEQTYNIDISKIEAALTAKTRAIVPVHLYGQPADMEGINGIAKQHKLGVIEDAAQAHLAEFNNRPVGSWGDAASFSFFPAKNLGAFGDAGMVVTNNQELALRMRMLSDHGRIEKYKHEIEGYNLRLDNLQAAILNVKLAHLKKWTEQRRQIAKFYDQGLSKAVVIPFVHQSAKHVYHQYVIRVKNRDQVQARLLEKGISSGIHYPIPLHLQPAYQYLGYRQGDFPVTEKCAQEILSLPIFPELQQGEMEQIVTAVNSVITF